MTGNVYPKNRKMPVWISQRKGISGFFVQILPEFQEKHNDFVKNPKKSDMCWKGEMVGRTAAFQHKNNAIYLKKCFESYNGKDIYERVRAEKDEKYRIVVVEVKLTDDLMRAEYRNYPVYAGRKMEILEEVK